MLIVCYLQFKLIFTAWKLIYNARRTLPLTIYVIIHAPEIFGDITILVITRRAVQYNCVTVCHVEIIACDGDRFIRVDDTHRIRCLNAVIVGHRQFEGIVPDLQVVDMAYRLTALTVSDPA